MRIIKERILCTLFDLSFLFSYTLYCTLDFSNKFHLQKCVHVCTDIILELNILALRTSFVYSVRLGNGYFLFKSSFYFEKEVLQIIA
jgi:hypothetical protein